MSDEKALDHLAYKAIALDVDGTLAGRDHRVSERSLDALRRAESAGLLPIIVTGRTEHAALSIAVAARLSMPVISCNGAVISDSRTRARIAECPMPKELLDRVLLLCRDLGLDPILWTADEMFASTDGWASRTLSTINEQPVTITRLRSIPSKLVVKAMVSGEPAELNRLADQIESTVPELQRSMDIFYEASPPGATKVDSLRRVLATANIKPSECIGIGDGDTDQRWLSAIAMPVAVANARASIRQLAVIEIGHHADDAVATFIHAFLDARAGVTSQSPR